MQTKPFILVVNIHVKEFFLVGVLWPQAPPLAPVYVSRIQYVWVIFSSELDLTLKVQQKHEKFAKFFDKVLQQGLMKSWRLVGSQ